MKRSIEKWFYGLAAAAIGGGAAAAATVIVHPEDMNTEKGLGKLLSVFAVSAIMNVFFYLKQSPLPPLSETTIITRTETEVTSTRKTVPPAPVETETPTDNKP